MVAASLILGVVIWRAAGGSAPLGWWRPDRRDLIAVVALYLGVVGVIRLAFVGFTA